MATKEHVFEGFSQSFFSFFTFLERFALLAACSTTGPGGNQKNQKGPMKTMTVQKLIEELNKLPHDLPVAMSKDDEGNNASTLAVVTLGHYEPGVTSLALALDRPPARQAV